MYVTLTASNMCLYLLKVNLTLCSILCRSDGMRGIESAAKKNHSNNTLAATESNTIDDELEESKKANEIASQIYAQTLKFLDSKIFRCMFHRLQVRMTYVAHKYVL